MSKTFDTKLEKHLKEFHGVSPFTEYLRPIVYGGSDGIVTTFAVVAGFTGAQTGGTAAYSIITVLLFGLANLFADGASMAVGEFLSSRSEGDMFRRQRRKEFYEIHAQPQMEKQQTVGILMKHGYNREDAEKMTSLYAKNKYFWLDFMMKYELSMNSLEERPHLNAIATFFSFIVFGFLPLVPYLFIGETITAFQLSIVFALGAMSLLGTLRWFVTRQGWFRSVLETVMLGALSAAIAFAVGTFFRA